MTYNSVKQTNVSASAFNNNNITIINPFKPKLFPKCFTLGSSNSLSQPAWACQTCLSSEEMSVYFLYMLGRDIPSLWEIRVNSTHTYDCVKFLIKSDTNIWSHTVVLFSYNHPNTVHTQLHLHAILNWASQRYSQAFCCPDTLISWLKK